MTSSVRPQPQQFKPLQSPVEAKNVLNCYEILNMRDFSWPVNVYRVEFADSTKQTHQNRGEAKDIIWRLRKNDCRNLWKGFGFVVDLNQWEVAVPQRWGLSEQIITAEYSVSMKRSFTATVNDAQGRAVIAGILRDGIKSHFKNNTSPDLGELWQDFDAFCQYPGSDWQQEYLMCRRFSVGIKALAGSRLVLQTNVSTTSLDGKCFADYYEAGHLHDLADMIESKRESRLTRMNRPIGVRVFHQPSEGAAAARALDLEDIEAILRHAQLPPDKQRKLGLPLLKCRPFGGKVLDVPACELRLILGSQITQEDHAETIIEPQERSEWMRKIRNFVVDCQVQGQTLELSHEPFSTDEFDHMVILPPAVRVRGRENKEVLIPSPNQVTDRSIQSRAWMRMDHIRQYGFLVQRSINPALAWPEKLDCERGNCLKEHLEAIFVDQGIDATFSLVPFHSADDLRRQVEKDGHDSVLVVLPEGWRAFRSGNDTHDQIKRLLDVPSQCIHHDHTLPLPLARQDWKTIKKMEDKWVRRIRQAYDITLGNLLVKNHWFPFAPYDPFHYQIHVGLDVGGVHNTHAVACLGYGFKHPTEGLLFLPEEIPIETQKKEPIPTESLYRGLLQMFERVYSELTGSGCKPDFDSVLFHRDGALLGDGDAWNERDALERLYVELNRRGWVSKNALWTVAEISKTAENWRLLRNEGVQVRNPMVGHAVFPFDDTNVAIVATTGSPYLWQGTALPLLVTVSNITGTADRRHVIQDVVWQADMCFTKPDMGMSLPWVLNVADKGALQLSKSYRICGITV
jgi:hypothetical protein